MAEYKVLITTSGIGSRLGELTNYTNKSLVRIGKKPGISYIVESYPDDVKLVITLGYFGNQVQDFLLMAYPNKKFTFVEVDNFDGKGSSLGYSILQAEKELQCPFIFHAADTVVSNKIKEPTSNWMGICKKDNHSQYRTVKLNGQLKIYEKGDFGSNYAYIGLAGIKDYEKFWKAIKTQYNNNPNDSSLSDVHGINQIIHSTSWSTIEYPDWLDIGNVSELKRSRDLIYDKFELLDKANESIFLFEDFVIKFFYNKEVCWNRIKRANQLYPLTPKILAGSDNFYKYEYADGNLFSNSVDEKSFKDFLQWSVDNLWVENETPPEFQEICEKFYFTKTLGRIDKFFKDNKIKDSETVINGYEVPTMSDLINMVDFDWLSHAKSYQFHGDFILDNIISINNKEFKLIDWRQDFGGDLVHGDIYYDLGKLNHNLLFNHDIVNRNLFDIYTDESGVKCDILRSDNLTNCREYFHKWIVDSGFDLLKVKLITAIIWINMAPLHESKIGEFLFYFGKLNLYKTIKEINETTIFHMSDVKECN
jgi:choline kinase